MYPEDVLAGASLFSELSRRDLKRLASATITRAYKKGDVIVKEGEDAAGCATCSRTFPEHRAIGALSRPPSLPGGRRPSPTL
jgi:hypothetical protein